MRKYSKMEKDRKYRIREYVRANILIPSGVLAKDLQLHKATIMAIKANITRRKY